MKFSIRHLAMVSMFTALTAVGAFVKIPIPPYPVPMTLQTAFVFLVGLLLPAREAFFSQITYVALGLIGIPIFTSGGGIGYLLNPTFGYLISFMIAAPILSKLATITLYRNRRLWFAFFGFFIIFMIQLLGVGYMAVISALYLQTSITFERATYLCLIFLPLDCLKFTLAVFIAQTLRRRLPNIFLTH